MPAPRGDHPVTLLAEFILAVELSELPVQDKDARYLAAISLGDHHLDVSLGWLEPAAVRRAG